METLKELNVEALEEAQFRELAINLMMNIMRDKSLVVAMEEMAELQQQISKAIRGKKDQKHLEEEVADVLICVTLIIRYLNLNDDEIDEWINFKCKRIIERTQMEELI